MKKALLIITGSLLIVVTVTASLLYFTSLGDGVFRKPEDIFYKNIALESNLETNLVERNVSNKNTSKLVSSQYFNGSDTVKATATATCNFTDKDLGNSSIEAQLLTEKSNVYFKIKSFTASKLTGEMKSLFEDYVAKISNKWVKSDEPLYASKALQENGFSAGSIGLIGKLDKNEMTMALKDNAVYEITSSKKVGSGSDRYYLLSVTTKRSNLAKAIKQIDGNYKELENLLKEIFDDKDSIKTDVAIRVSDAKTLWQEYETDDACNEIVPSSSRSKLQRIRMRQDWVDTSDAKNITTPRGFITEKQLQEIQG
jgi:hypothetical protein